jgi:hypothetical protein
MISVLFILRRTQAKNGYFGNYFLMNENIQTDSGGACQSSWNINQMIPITDILIIWVKFRKFNETWQFDSKRKTCQKYGF